MGYFRRVKNPSSFRKLAAAMWGSPNDPHIYGSLDVDATAAVDFLKRYNARSAHNVTVTHLVGRALAVVLARNPEYNAKITWNSILMRSSIDIFCQVATDSGRDLSGKKIPNVDQLSLEEFAGVLRSSAEAIRSDRDPDFRRTRNLFKVAPLWLLRWLLRLMSLLSNTLHLHLPKLGLPRDPFGSAMVTSVGMFGIDYGFAPLVPLARCPIVITVTQIRSRPWVVGDRVEPRPVLRLCAAFDHRVIDGFSAGRLSNDMEDLLNRPEELLLPAEDPLE